MTELTATRARLAIFALALGGFSIGATEFIAMGLLPEISSDLLKELSLVDSEAAIAKAGWLITAYAIGVVVGAPTIAAASARFPRRSLLIVLALGFTLGSVASAVAPTFETVVAARFVSGLGHGAFFGVAALVAARLMGPEKRGQAVASVLVGLTIASVVGVPTITFVGQQVGWRWAYLVVAALFAVTTFAIAAFVPRSQGDPRATISRELLAFRRPAVWFALLTGSLGFGGFFAVYSYVAPLSTEVAGASSGFVPVVLMVLGVGTTIGILGGGRLADRGAVRAIFLLFGALAISLTFLGLTAHTVPGLLIGVFLVGGSAQALAPAIQTRLMDVAGDSQTLAAAVNHSALNIGNSLGAALGGAVIAAGLGYVAPTWLGLALCVPGSVFALAGWMVTRRQSQPPPRDELAIPVG
ncbi:MFS transporter [Demequina sp. TTPB684]|uniref:MFS transporter n=1 Tax=unclassified Demequina TaxID=2620311 RepID=UPI001CF33387|nr:MULTISPECIES: MFS transporter [unclassified Demequina]MCB2413781.1 MFS transporter [Demequina sp. TTPB684]UPU89311.1 MFS transporter [Demequina sp. TMPB413]